MRREERVARQSRDDGAPEATVVVGKVSMSAECYHDPAVDCYNRETIDEPREMTREAAQRRGLRPCSVCVLGQRPSGGRGGPRITDDGEVVWGG